MTSIRKNYSAQEKAKIALEALKGNMTIAELTSKYKIHASQIGAWKKRLKENIADLFSDKKKQKDKDQSELINELYSTIGRQKYELEWLKKKLISSNGAVLNMNVFI